MAKRKLKLIEDKKGLLKVKNPQMKHCSVKLQRLSRDVVDRFLRGQSTPERDIIHHKINVQINRNGMMMENRMIKNTNNTFTIQLKVTSAGVTVLNSPSKLTSHRVAILKNPSKLIVSKPINLSQNIDILWRKSKNILDKNKLSINDLVMSKLRGFLPWPSKVLGITKRKTFDEIKVEFYGAEPFERFGFVKINEVAYFKDCIDLIKVILRRNPLKFIKGVKEVEVIFGLPESLSILSN